MGQFSPENCKAFGLQDDVTLVTGTTDSCASFLATGADQIGDAVSVLGTTLTVKLLSDMQVFDANVGVYSRLDESAQPALARGTGTARFHRGGCQDHSFSHEGAYMKPVRL